MSLNAEFDNLLFALEEFFDSKAQTPSIPTPEAGRFLLWNNSADALVNSELSITNILQEISDGLTTHQTNLNKAYTIATSSNTQGLFGIINNLFAILNSTHPEFVADLGLVNTSPLEVEDWGNTAESSSQNVDNGNI
jgi:hypothetical protein